MTVLTHSGELIHGVENERSQRSRDEDGEDARWRDTEVDAPQRRAVTVANGLERRDQKPDHQEQRGEIHQEIEFRCSRADDGRRLTRRRQHRPRRSEKPSDAAEDPVGEGVEESTRRRCEVTACDAQLRVEQCTTSDPLRTLRPVLKKKLINVGAAPMRIAATSEVKTARRPCDDWCMFCV